MERVLDAISDDSVTSVGAAIEARADVVVLREDVYQLAFAFIAPLRAEDDSEVGVQPGFAAIARSLD